MVGIAGQDLRKGTRIIDTSTIRIKNPVEIVLPFGSSDRVTFTQITRWLMAKLKVPYEEAVDAILDPERASKASCKREYRYSLSVALSSLYGSEKMSRDQVCRAMVILGYELQYNGQMIHLVGRKEGGGQGKGKFKKIEKASYIWKSSSDYAPWRGLADYEKKTSWTSSMLYLYFTRYVKKTADEVVKALKDAEEGSKTCNQLYPKKLQPERSDAELPSAEGYYTGKQVIMVLLPKVRLVAYRLKADGKYEKVINGQFKKGETLYRIFKNTETTGRANPFEVTFNPADLLTRKDITQWLKKSVKLDDTRISKVFN